MPRKSNRALQAAQARAKALSELHSFRIDFRRLALESDLGAVRMCWKEVDQPPQWKLGQILPIDPGKDTGQVVVSSLDFTEACNAAAGHMPFCHSDWPKVDPNGLFYTYVFFGQESDEQCLGEYARLAEQSLKSLHAIGLAPKLPELEARLVDHCYEFMLIDFTFRMADKYPSRQLRIEKKFWVQWNDQPSFSLDDEKEIAKFAAKHCGNSPPTSKLPLLMLAENVFRATATAIAAVLAKLALDDKRPKWDPATEDRNKWIYEKCMDRVKYSTIKNQLKGMPATWGGIDSVNGIKKAAIAYAKWHELPEPPRRKSGRRPASKRGNNRR